MADEIMMAIATAFAGKLGEAAFATTQQGWVRLAHLIRKRLGQGEHSEVAALESIQRNPADPDAVHKLAEALEQLTATDHEFDVQLRALWPQASSELSASRVCTINVTSGNIGGHLIQARDLRVEGGLHLGDTTRPAGK